MHIRIHRSKTQHGFREYAQLVQSYRRPDGMPAHRILATLGPPDSLVVQNMRQALTAARAGKASVQGPQRLAAPARPLSNLRYLDAAVLLELWKRWGLEALFNKLLPRGQAELCLQQPIQQDVLAGRAQGHCIASLVQIAKLAKDEQRDAFDALLARAPAARTRPAQIVVEQSDTPIQVRAVAYFNPERFVDSRLAVNRKLERVRCKVQDIVVKANHNPKRYTDATVRLQIDRILTKESLLDVHSVHIRVDKSAPELCKLYRAKDAVEKDFQVIKSFTLATLKMKHLAHDEYLAERLEKAS